MKYLKKFNQLNESIECIESQISCLKKLKNTHFVQKNDNEDANCAHTLAKYFNENTRKWEDISLGELNDKLKSLEEELELSKKTK